MVLIVRRMMDKTKPSQPSIDLSRTMTIAPHHRDSSHPRSVTSEHPLPTLPRRRRSRRSC
jgi:hypothetical protein